MEMLKLKLLQRVQAEISSHRELLELRTRVKLSFDEEKLIVHYRHPRTGRETSLAACLINELLKDEKRAIAAIVRQLKGWSGTGGQTR
jgi:hypothetical protein